MQSTWQNVQIIINPAAGAPEPILHTLNTAFSPVALNWQVAVTRDTEHTTELARTAVDNGADLVAAYGGDGTLMAVINGLVGSNVPLAILPGGTGNAMAFELGIPQDLAAAAALISGDSTVRYIDLGRMNDRYFMLRFYTGIELTQQADRELKDRFGFVAYLMASLRLLTEPPQAHYQITVDGNSFSRDAALCLITNASHLGGINVTIASDIDPTDGLLDLIVLDDAARSALSAATNLLEFKGLAETFPVHQGHEITIVADPPQTIWLDGEMMGQTPVTAVAIPRTLPVLVPPNKEES